tara:strand:+ start:13717 stop:14676 length:960 start_codon:yes stop_codon:yes gene_type:complete
MKLRLRIQIYEKKFEQIWDNFIDNGVLGTIYHTRKFINYHPKERFQDKSILIFNNNVLICVLPCCKKGDKYFSYTGATYGGPVFLKKYYKTKYLIPIINKIFDYYDNQIEFRLANAIYFDESSFILQYLLSRKLNLKLELSWYINIENNFIDNIPEKSKKKAIKKIIKNNSLKCFIAKDENDYKEYHKILTELLNTRYKTNPTHNLKELLLLKEYLKEKQELYLVKENNIIIAGVYIIKVTNQCWYTVYMTRNINFKNSTIALMYILYHISNNAKSNNVKYLDYGICTEEQGKTINEGLSIFKEESLGGISNYRYLFLK